VLGGQQPPGALCSASFELQSGRLLVDDSLTIALGLMAKMHTSRAQRMKSGMTGWWGGAHGKITGKQFQSFHSPLTKSLPSLTLSPAQIPRSLLVLHHWTLSPTPPPPPMHPGITWRGLEGVRQ